MMLAAGFLPSHLQNPAVLELEGTEQQESVPLLAASRLLRLTPAPELALKATARAVPVLLPHGCCCLAHLVLLLRSLYESARQPEPAKPGQAWQVSRDLGSARV